MNNILYKVKVTQEIPLVDFDEDGEEITTGSSGQIETYIAGTFKAEPNARLFAEALENKIAEGTGYVISHFTPRVQIIKVSRTEEVLEKCR